MLRNVFCFAPLLAILALCGISLAAASKIQVVTRPALDQSASISQPLKTNSTPLIRNADGSEDLSHLPAAEVPREPTNPLDVVGNLYEAGITYYDLQQNATVGRMIGVDQQGRVHVTWMNAASTLSPRHVSYNWFNSETGVPAFAGGVEIDSSLRSGFTNIAVHLQTGRAYPAYHELQSSDPNIHSAAAMSGSIGGGWFLSTQPNYLYDSLGSLALIWPKVAVGSDSVVHMVSTRANSPDGLSPFYYSRGIARQSGGFGTGIEWQTVDVVDGQPSQFMLVDTDQVSVSANIAASSYTDRVAIVWNKRLRDPLTGVPLNDVSDIYVQISEDNGLNWAAPINITNFCGPDANCPNQDWQACNGDTLRAWIDNSVLVTSDIDVAFTVVSYHYWDEFGQPTQDTRYPRSAIWHWNSGTEEFSPIVTAFGESSIPGGWSNAGVRHLAVCKPSLAVDTTVSNLYCSYWRAMPDQWSESGYPMGDVYISRSADPNGAAWSIGKNVTQTDGGQFAPAGSSLSEREPSIAELVLSREWGDFSHSVLLFYELDRDAGTAINGEGAITRNELYFQDVPVDSIPATPTVPWGPLHVDPVTGACCYGSSATQFECAQLTTCECAALGGVFHGTGSSTCVPENDQCPGTTIHCLPFTASGNNCCASIDFEDCGIPAKDVFFNFVSPYATTIRLSLCDSPESWNSYISIYRMGGDSTCTGATRVACLDRGCSDQNHVDQLFAVDAGVLYIFSLSGYYAEDCGPYVLNVSDATDYAQPDTLQYDNGQTYAVSNSDSLWVRVRFTAPADFELRTAYVGTAFADSCGARCSVFAYDTTPAPGGQATQASAPIPISSGWDEPVWINALFEDTITVSADSDFWITAGPGTGGGLSPGLKFRLTTSASGRSEHTHGDLYGTYSMVGNDYMIRAGGVIGLGVPDSLVIRSANNGADAELNWSAAANADEYRIYRSLSDDIQPLPENLIGTSATTSYLDAGVLLQPSPQYYYLVTATRAVSLSSTGIVLPNLPGTTAQESKTTHNPMQLKSR